MYRPEGMKDNPYRVNSAYDPWEAYEAGADAMLEGLKEKGIYGKPTGDFECFCMVKPDECDDPHDDNFPLEPMYPDEITRGHKKGWLVFIPEE